MVLYFAFAFESEGDGGQEKVTSDVGEMIIDGQRLYFEQENGESGIGERGGRDNPQRQSLIIESTKINRRIHHVFDAQCVRSIGDRDAY